MMGLSPRWVPLTIILLLMIALVGYEVWIAL